MEIAKKSFFVPWDFTEKAEYAFQHAYNLAKNFNKEITLLHIVKKEKYKAEVEPKLKEVAEQHQEKYGINVTYLIVAGDLFKTMSKTAEEYEASLVVMGMHSSKRATKTIMGSQVPFYLVQEPPKKEKITEIVVPIDTDEKNRVQLRWVTYLAKYFNCNINIIKPFINNDAKNRKMKANMMFARKVLDSKDVVYGIRTAKREMKWHHAIHKFALDIDAELIFVMSSEFKKLVKGMEKENCTIPIICINPATGLKVLPDKFA